MTRAFVFAVSICLVAAALEALFAGSGIRQRLAELRLPRFAVPFAGWVAIGIFYYLICGAVLYRLFGLPPTADRSIAFSLLGTLLFINALWNYFFFRTRNLFHCFLLGVPYNALALALFVLLLLRVDQIAAWSFLPYLLYLFYANFWGYRTWKLNPSC